MSEEMSGAPTTKPRVRLIGVDGNAFAILGRVRRALREAGASADYIKQYTREAQSGGYANLLKVTLEYVHEADEE